MIIHLYCLFDLDPEVSSLTSCHQHGSFRTLSMAAYAIIGVQQLQQGVDSTACGFGLSMIPDELVFFRGMSSFFFPKDPKSCGTWLFRIPFPFLAHWHSFDTTDCILRALSAQWIVMDRPVWRCHNYWNFCGHFWHFPWSWPWAGSWLRSLDASRRPMTYENERPWGMLWYAWVANGLSSHAVGTKFNS